MMKQCQYGILSASVRGVCELHWVLLKAGSCEKSTQNQSLHTLHRDGSEGDRAEVILYFCRRFLWYRDDGSCLPKKRDVASVQGLLKKPREDWRQEVIALLKNSTSDLVRTASTVLFKASLNLLCPNLDPLIIVFP